MVDRASPGGVVIPSSVRSLGPPDPLTQPVRSDIPPNANEPAGGVGPNVPTAGDVAAWQGESGGFGATHVMTTPAELAMMPWAGWPAQWDTPTSGAGWDMSKGLDVVFGCIDLNSRTVADMPVFVTKYGRLQPPPSWLENPQPEIHVSYSEFFRTAVASYYAAGECFIVRTSQFADGSPRTFTVLHPSVVTPVLDPATGLRRYWINGVEPDPGELLHIRYQTDPLVARGIGPLEYAGARIMAVQALMRYGSNLANNGGVPWAVLQHKYRLKPGQAEQMKLQWIAAARSRMGAPAILDSDTTLKELQVSPKDMALTDLQAAAEARLCVLLGVPPFQFGLPSGGDSLQYTNTSNLFAYHWRSSLRPAGNFIIGAISNWALPLHTELELNPNLYIEESPAVRGQYYESMSRIGAMSVEEIRAAERFVATAAQPELPINPEPEPEPAEPKGAPADA